MRITEPKYFKHEQKPQKKRPVYAGLLLILILLGGLLAYQQFTKESLPDNLESNAQTVSPNESTKQIDDVSGDKNSGPKTLRVFTDNEFNVFYNQLLQPNLERVTNPPSISGNEVADAIIRKIAEDRGYKLRNSPTKELINVDGYLLQSAVKEPWAQLKTAAKKAGHSISILSGYRSVERQRTLYLTRLAATGATISQVAAGEADKKVNEVLVTSSIPGYSKHHTGYTIDILCAGFTFENFKNSTCNDWLAENNYKVAKEHGFIPSYPPLADSQGPDPEAWEYVYVGTDLMYE